MPTQVAWLVHTLAILLVSGTAVASECDKAAYLFVSTCRTNSASPAVELVEYADYLVCDELRASPSLAKQEAIHRVSHAFTISSADLRPPTWYSRANCGQLATEGARGEAYVAALKQEWNRSCNRGYDSCVAAEKRIASRSGTLTCRLDAVALGELQLTVRYTTRGREVSKPVPLKQVVVGGALECEKPIGGISSGGISVAPCFRTGPGSGKVDVVLDNGLQCLRPAEMKATQASSVDPSNRTCASVLSSIPIGGTDGYSVIRPLMVGLCSQCMARNDQDVSRKYPEKVATCAVWAMYALANKGTASCGAQNQTHGVALGSANPSVPPLRCAPPRQQGVPPGAPPFQGGGEPPLQWGAPMFLPNGPAVLQPSSATGADFQGVLVLGREWASPPFGRWQPPPDLLSLAKWRDALTRFAGGAALGRAMELASNP
jgi:hypothetical protein